MKAFFAAVAVAVGIAIVASMVLNSSFQTTSYAQFTTEGARISGPGDNLVTF